MAIHVRFQSLYSSRATSLISFTHTAHVHARGRMQNHARARTWTYAVWVRHWRPTDLAFRYIVSGHY